MTDQEDPLSALVRILKPLDSPDRHRTIKAAMLYLEDTVPVLGAVPEQKTKTDGAAAENSAIPAHMQQWMRSHSVTTEQLEHAFRVDKDGKHSVADVPGTSKKERTLNAYVLTGLGNYLYTNDRNFTDAEARSVCEHVRCYDTNNHSAYLKERQSNFNGDKAKGYGITPTGIKEGAVLVKALSRLSGSA